MSHRWGILDLVKYLLLIRGDETAAAHAEDGCGGWTEEMAERGVLRGGAGLTSPTEGATVRSRDEVLSVVDGPFAETKEQVGGFCLIECGDRDEAIVIAAKHPAAAYGSIEVRALWQP